MGVDFLLESWRNKTCQTGLNLAHFCIAYQGSLKYFKYSMTSYSFPKFHGSTFFRDPNIVWNNNTCNLDSKTLLWERNMPLVIEQ